MLEVIVPFGGMAAAASLELVLPHHRRELPATRRRLGNLGVWMVNLTATGLLFATPQHVRAAMGIASPDWSALPVWASYSLTFLTLDLLVYLLHRMLHATPLWHLHRLHHSDPEVDTTTTVRHHPLEVLSMSAIVWGIIIVVAFPPEAVAARNLITFALAIATHANVRWPRWLERAAAPVIITLDAHLLHHSTEPDQQNANFGGVLSLWDRLGGTYRAPEPVPSYGVSRRDTIKLADGRVLETSIQSAGGRVRLRANLVSGGFVAYSLKRDYACCASAADIERFTRELEEISRVALPRPLFASFVR